MKKGKLYYGVAGVGKTTLLKTDYENFQVGGKRWMTARQIARIGQADGLLGVEQAVQSSLHFFVDDIGHESTTVSHFGTVLSPVSEFIQSCYESFQEWPRLERTIHFTSNLSPEALRERYGDFIVDRLIEMCEWVHIEGESFRK